MSGLEVCQGFVIFNIRKLSVCITKYSNKVKEIFRIPKTSFWAFFPRWVARGGKTLLSQLS